MNVQLISHTRDALDLLLFSKETRLEFDPGELAKIRALPDEEKMERLRYILGTIQSSWEFVDYTFLITGVSRAFTHQLVRTRHASFAQQSQRTVDMSGFEFIVPKALQEAWPSASVYQLTMQRINAAYQDLIARGVAPQDARGLLPTNISTSVLMKANLRTLSDMAKTRLCTRTQGEYQDVFREMRKEVISVHPWAEPFIRVACAATGVCQFPNYKECPIKGPIFNPDTGKRWDELRWFAQGSGWVNATPNTKEQIQKDWEQVRFEAVPKGGQKP